MLDKINLRKCVMKYGYKNGITLVGIVKRNWTLNKEDYTKCNII